MLIPTRRTGETIRIGEDIAVPVLAVMGSQVRNGIDAPDGMRVNRDEVPRRVMHEQAGGGSPWQDNAASIAPVQPVPWFEILPSSQASSEPRHHDAKISLHRLQAVFPTSKNGTTAVVDLLWRLVPPCGRSGRLPASPWFRAGDTAHRGMRVSGLPTRPRLPELAGSRYEVATAAGDTGRSHWRWRCWPAGHGFVCW